MCMAMHTASPDITVLRPAQVSQAIGLSTTTLWRLRQRGEFPEPVRLSAGAVGWRRSDIAAWLDGRAGQGR